MNATAALPTEADSGVTVERALSVPTRAGIYRRLRAEASPVTARDVAEMFGLHPNVARNHLDTLHDAGLVVTGRRKHPGGGRPAKVYVAREQADDDRPVTVPDGTQLAIGVLVQLLAGRDDAHAEAERIAADQGRRLVDASAGKADQRDLESAALVAVEALRPAFPELRLSDTGDDHVVIEGLEVGLRLVGQADGVLGDALARGLLSGAVLAAGAPNVATAHEGRVTLHRDVEGAAATPVPSTTVDARGETYQAGVVATMRAIMKLRPGDHLEVMTDTQGAPAAFARWADRAGHQVVDVARVRDLQGREGVRLLLRKAAP